METQMEKRAKTEVKTETKVRTRDIKAEYVLPTEMKEKIEGLLLLCEKEMDTEFYSFKVRWNDEEEDTYAFSWVASGKWEFFENGKICKGYQQGIRGENGIEHRFYVRAWTSKK